MKATRHSFLMLALAVSMALLSAISCAGKNPPPEDPPLADTSRPQKRVPSPAVQAYCAALCPRMTTCALEDARSSPKLSPKELAELEEVAPRHTQVCREACDGTRPKQAVMDASHRCLNEQTACSPLLDCLDAAEKLQNASEPATPGN